MSKKLFLFHLIFLLTLSQYGICQTYTLTGNSFAERCESLVNCMVNEVEPYSNGVNIKYTAPFYWARLYKDIDTERALERLEALYDKVLESPSAFQSSGSDIEFYSHMTIHGYFLCKEKIPAKLRMKIKACLALVDFNSIGSTSTLNLDMMKYTAGLMAAQEWSDFKDKNNKNASEIIEYNRPRILNTLDLMYHNNCKEMDAFVYLPTNMMYLRMLAEFCEDEEVRQRAWVTYQQMIAAMAGAWNQGMYVATPPRAKGWEQLVSGPLGTNSRITMLSWLYFGNPTNTLAMANQFTSDSNNGAVFCFWLAYKGNITPLREIIDAEKRKTFPYEYISYIDDKTVSRTNTVNENWKYYKYTWQSQNYGLATQTEIPYNLSKALSLYAYKEIKRTYLTWQAEGTNRGFFTICQDNPERPTDVVNANGVAYGENPYHRVLQYKGAAIGITDVPTTYVNGKRYQMYVPLTHQGVKLKIEADDWVFCHGGSMMFAFRTIEPYKMWSGRIPYNIPNSDLLMLEDMEARKASWILQTTEITDDLKGEDMEEELEKFRQKLLTSTSFETINYDSELPRLQYTTMDGDLLDLTFFAPNLSYTDQHKINGEVLELRDSHLFNSPYTKQENKSDDVYIYNDPNNPTILNWNDPIRDPALNISETILSKENIQCHIRENNLEISGIPVQGKTRIELYDLTGNKLFREDTEVTEGMCNITIPYLSGSVYILSIHTSIQSWTVKCMK